jgi:hypothetical protein
MNMKYRLALAHGQPADARVDIELNEDGLVRIAGGVWKTVGELAVDLETPAGEASLPCDSYPSVGADQSVRGQ